MSKRRGSRQTQTDENYRQNSASPPSRGSDRGRGTAVGSPSSTSTGGERSRGRGDTAGRSGDRVRRSRGAAPSVSTSVDAALAFISPLGLSAIVIVVVLAAGLLLLHM